MSLNTDELHKKKKKFIYNTEETDYFSEPLVNAELVYNLWLK